MAFNKPENKERKPFGFKRIKKKRCKMCIGRIKTLDFKDEDYLKNFITERGKIIPRRVTGNCAKHQRMLTASIKKAREAALLPFVTQ
ncbi:MAG: 30S ribosomal protein S18 [Spirochaetia bacterium]|nr:30S ribosomal protein S18 [Spirochaetia bacterium]